MSEAVHGRLFGPGLAGTGVDVRLSWRGDRLAVALPDGERLVAGERLRCDAGGFNAEQAWLRWAEDEGEFLLCLDSAAGRALAAAAPATVAEGLLAAGRARRRLTWRFALGWGLLAPILLLPLLLLALFLAKADTIAAAVAERIPAEQEARLGDLALAQIQAELRLQEQGPAVEAVRAIGQRLSAGLRHTYRFLVADSPQVNAFAAPGGVIVVYTGLIRAADDAEELAGVLAHEVAHVELRHGLKSMVKGLGLRALLALALGDGAGLAGDLATRLTELKFSREAEAEADREGLRRLLAADIAPYGLPRFLEKLAEREGDLAEAAALLSSHPPSKERLQRLRAELAQLPPREFLPLPLDWASVRAAVQPPTPSMASPAAGATSASPSGAPSS